MGALKTPHGGELKNLYLGKAEAEAQKAASRELISWDLTPRQLCDIELLLNGGFSPLEGFLGQADYERVLSDTHLESGVLWPMPVTLDVSTAFAETVGVGDTIALRDREGVLIATMTITDKWRPDMRAEAEAVLGSSDEAHPEASRLIHDAGPVYLGGPVHGVAKPVHFDFKHTATRLRNCAICSRNGVAKSRRLSDTQSHAPRSPRADLSALRAKRRRTFCSTRWSA